MHTRSSTRIAALQLSLRAAVAAGSAVAISEFLELQYPLLALLAAVIVMDLSPSKTRRLALQRLAGTLLGATLGATLSAYLPAGPLATGFSVLAAMLLSHVILAREGSKAGRIRQWHRRARSRRTTVVLRLVPLDRNPAGRRHGRAREPGTEAVGSGDTRRRAGLLDGVACVIRAGQPLASLVSGLAVLLLVGAGVDAQLGQNCLRQH